MEHREGKGQASVHNFTIDTLPTIHQQQLFYINQITWKKATMFAVWERSQVPFHFSQLNSQRQHLRSSASSVSACPAFPHFQEAFGDFIFQASVFMQAFRSSSDFGRGFQPARCQCRHRRSLLSLSSSGGGNQLFRVSISSSLLIAWALGRRQAGPPTPIPCAIYVMRYATVHHR